MVKALLRTSNDERSLVPMRTYKVPDSLVKAHTTKPTPDPQMPVLDGIMDPSNMVWLFPGECFKDTQIKIQRVSLLGTEWLGLRLPHCSMSHNLRFCFCVASLHNLGRKTAKSSVLEVTNPCDSGNPYMIVLVPLYDVRDPASSDNLTRFLELSETICELARMVKNSERQKIPEKQFLKQVKAWCETQSNKYGETKRSSRRNSFHEFQQKVGAFLEDKLASLVSDPTTVDSHKGRGSNRLALPPTHIKSRPRLAMPPDLEAIYLKRNAHRARVNSDPGSPTHSRSLSRDDGRRRRKSDPEPNSPEVSGRGPWQDAEPYEIRVAPPEGGEKSRHKKRNSMPSRSREPSPLCMLTLEEEHTTLFSPSKNYLPDVREKPVKPKGSSLAATYKRRNSH
jgi:hypothetical protein